MSGIQPGELPSVQSRVKLKTKKRRVSVGMKKNPIQAAKNKALNLDAGKIRKIFDSLSLGEGIPQKFNWKQYTKSNEGGRICLWPIVLTLMHELVKYETREDNDKKIILSNLIEDITNKETSKNIFNMFFEDLSKEGDLRSIIASIDLPISGEKFVTSKHTAGVVLLLRFEDGLNTLIEKFKQKEDFSVYRDKIRQNLEQILEYKDLLLALPDESETLIKKVVDEFEKGEIEEIEEASKVLDMLKKSVPR